MSAPFDDIGINPFKSDRRQFRGGVATGSGVTYGAVVVADTGTTNARDCKLPSGAAAKSLLGVVSDQGDPNSSGAFAVGDEFGICTSGVVEVLLDAGYAATKGAPAITSGSAGAVKKWTSETDVDILGTFEQDYDNSGGSDPVLVSLMVNIYRKT